MQNTNKDYTKENIALSKVHAMLKSFSNDQLSMHSVLVYQHGTIVGEYYAPPFDETTFHRMYSVSKSFVGIAVGILLNDEDYKMNFPFGLDTPLSKVPCFTENINENTDQRIKKCTIRNLLCMATPFPKGSTYDGPKDMNWEATFFNPSPSRAPNHEPGEKFHYDTSASYILDVMIEKTTKMPFLDYLKEKALNQIDFSKDAWCVQSPEGYSWGGSGILCTTRDLAKFSYLVMHEGNWEGKQLLPKEYVKQAISKQINITYEDDEDATGYGYQIWTTDFGFAFLGMGCQLSICVPSMDLVFVCTADNQGFKLNDKSAKQIIFETFQKEILLNNENINNAFLQNKEVKLQIPYQIGLKDSNLLKQVQQKEYFTTECDISSFQLNFEGSCGVLCYSTSRGIKKIQFGIGFNKKCLLEEPGYSGRAINHPNGKGYYSLCSGAWIDQNTFQIWVQVCDDYFGNMKMKFHFEENEATLTITKNAEWFLDEYKIKNVKYKNKQ